MIVIMIMLITGERNCFAVCPERGLTVQQFCGNLDPC